ncbi:hypothetical protein LXL04_019837 [Taraxacum kok-saghyz]
MPGQVRPSVGVFACDELWVARYILEYREVDIDESLVAAKSVRVEDIVMLDNGCLCCTVRSDLVRMIGELMDKKKGNFVHIVIETTGNKSTPYQFKVRPKYQENESEVAEVDGTKENAPTIQHVLIVDDLSDGSNENKLSKRERENKSQPLAQQGGNFVIKYLKLRKENNHLPELPHHRLNHRTTAAGTVGAGTTVAGTTKSTPLHYLQICLSSPPSVYTRFSS